MEDSFGINAVALVDGQPRTLALKQMLEVYLEHRFDVVRRRSIFRRAKATDRLHLVEGLLTAILDIDEVIQLIRSSDNAEMARARLMSVFDLTEIQANYILDMPLRRLTKFSRLELEDEKAALEAHHRGADRDPRRRQAAAEGRRRRAVGGRQAARHATPDHPAGVGRLARDGCGAARGERRPLLRVPVVGRPARPYRQRRGSGTRRRPGQARRDRGQGGSDRPRNRRRRHVGRPAGQARRPRPAGAPVDGQRPAAAGWGAGQRVPLTRSGRARRSP